MRGLLEEVLQEECLVVRSLCQRGLLGLLLVDQRLVGRLVMPSRDLLVMLGLRHVGQSQLAPLPFVPHEVLLVLVVGAVVPGVDAGCSSLVVMRRLLRKLVQKLVPHLVSELVLCR